MPLDPLTAFLSALGTLGLHQIAQAAFRTWRARYAATHATQVQADSTDLTREERLMQRVSVLEGQFATVSTQLLDSERVRARQEAQLADVCQERDSWKAQFHDLAVSVQAEDDPIGARIWQRYQREQIDRSAPKE